MRKPFKGIAALIAAMAMALTGCSSDAPSSDSSTPATTATVTVKDAKGMDVEVPVNPETVISLDNRTFETLAAWGVKLAAVPKDVMPADDPYVKDDSVVDLGNHKDNFKKEQIAALDPDLVIVGQRFAKYTDEIKTLVPNAAVLDLNMDVSEKAEKPGENLINGFKNSTESLGKIFQKEDEAKKLNDALDKSMADAKAAYNGTDTVMAVNVAGGNIGYIAPHFGRVYGPLFEVVGWKPALENVAGASSDHKGDDISVEAIAESNPIWLLVLDRDAAVSGENTSAAAKDVIEGSEALKNIVALKDGHVYYAPADTYTNESIQTLTEILEGIAAAMAK